MSFIYHTYVQLRKEVGSRKTPTNQSSRSVTAPADFYVIRKKIRKHIVLITTFLMLSAISGCGTMMFLFGDNIRYSLSGKVQDASAPDDKGIQGVTVAVDCPGLEKPIYQNSKGVTDANGNYELTGYWELQGCEIKAFF